MPREQRHYNAQVGHAILMESGHIKDLKPCLEPTMMQFDRCGEPFCIWTGNTFESEQDNTVFMTPTMGIRIPGQSDPYQIIGVCKRHEGNTWGPIVPLLEQPTECAQIEMMNNANISYDISTDDDIDVAWRDGAAVRVKDRTFMLFCAKARECFTQKPFPAIGIAHLIPGQAFDDSESWELLPPHKLHLGKIDGSVSHFKSGQIEMPVAFWHNNRLYLSVLTKHPYPKNKTNQYHLKDEATRLYLVNHDALLNHSVLSLEPVRVQSMRTNTPIFLDKGRVSGDGLWGSSVVSDGRRVFLIGCGSSSKIGAPFPYLGFVAIECGLSDGTLTVPFDDLWFQDGRLRITSVDN